MRSKVKQLFVLIACTMGNIFMVHAQMPRPESSDFQQLKDKIELKELVDRFSILADKKDVDNQVLLFTEDAIVEFYNGDVQQGGVKGRERLKAVFAPYLALFDVVYHINGQHTVSVAGDKATGISYCQVILIGDENGKRMMKTEGVYYNDEYVRINGRWLISKRASHFMWRDEKEIM